MWPIIGGIGFVGLSTAEYGGMISTVGLIMAIVAIGVGSFLTVRLGARRATVLVYVTYALMALFVLYFMSVWVALPAFIALSCVWQLHDTLTSICSNPLRMQLSDPQVAATQFTIYNSLSNLPVSYGALLFATLGGTGKFPLVMWTLASMCLAGAAIYALMKTGSRHQPAPPVPEID